MRIFVTKKEVEKLFKESIMPSIRRRFEKDDKPDYIARTEGWNEFTDSLCKEGEITLKQYNNWRCPKICGK